MEPLPARALLSSSVAHWFDRFEEIVLGDSEFLPRPGELYRPVCVAYKELRSGRSGVLADYELGPHPPHAHGPNVLYIGFTGAEPEFYHSVGWGFDCAFLDIRVMGIHQTNFALPREDPETKKKRPKPPRSLIQFLRVNGIQDGDANLKDKMRDRILRGPPYTPEEYDQFKRYCLGDVLLLERLVDATVPRIKNLAQALHYGEFVKFCAEIFAAGIPADPWSSGLLRDSEVRKTLRLRAVADETLTQGLYRQDDASLTQARMKEFLIRHGLFNTWRRTRKGTLSTRNQDFELLEARLPKQFRGIADVHKLVKQLREWQLFAGADGRFRAQLWPFSTITSRAAPDASAYPFTTAAWGRFGVMPGPGKVLIYLDYSSMEFGVAAGRSQCAQMIADYHREPYLVLPILAGQLPKDATKKTHGEERDRYKPMILAIQYGGGHLLLASRLGLTPSQGQRLVTLHHDRYADYWEWSDWKLQYAFEDGELVALDGWRCGIDSRTNRFTARNWLIQTHSAAQFRYACLLMRSLGLKVVALVHDAVLVEASLEDHERVQAQAIDCLVRASRRFLHGLELRAEGKVIMPGERFIDARGTRTWAFVEQGLRELIEERRRAS
jgi:hypothetical protein